MAKPGRLAIIVIGEGTEVTLESALLAGLVESLGIETVAIDLDSCTAEEAFAASLHAAQVEAVALPWTLEWRELVQHAVGVAKKRCGLPSLVFGDGIVRNGFESGAPAAEVHVLARLTAEDLPASWREDPAAEAPSGARLSFGYLGSDRICTRGTASSLFGEPGEVGAIFRECDRRELSPAALLARMQAPSAQPRRLNEGSIIAALDALQADSLRVAWWDRHLQAQDLERLESIHKQRPSWRFSLRVDPRTRKDLAPSRLVALGVRRVVFDCDALAEKPALPGSAWTAEALAEAALAYREAGLEIGVLFVVGLPGESIAVAARRREVLAALVPDRLRCVPFEPTGGHAARQRCDAEGWLAQTGEPWIREVHRPLRLPELDAEAFVQVWAAALDLLADIEVAYRKPQS